MTRALTPSLENYLETIFLLKEKQGEVRVKDVAGAMKLKMGSVAGALKNLVEKGLVIHEHYGHIELTQKGMIAAADVYRRHKVLFSFFKDILNVPEGRAEEDACQIEHHISQESLVKLVKLIDFFLDDSYSDRLMSLKNHIKDSENQPMVPLSKLKAGQVVRIVKVEGDPRLKRRLLDMGMVPGTLIRVEKVAPFGSPMIIEIRGFHLSLRREELQSVLAESV